ncbi:hypothetical protein AB4513_24585, partial [Vibrio sp. 10N.222.54.E6]|uniref:hypothetical protein n=1 Tax=Vibrio sp. 10N.222.54.E6 TaxID=3229642 RepID=UPI00354DFDA1
LVVTRNCPKTSQPEFSRVAFSSSKMPLYQLEQELIHILLMAIYPTKSYPNSVHLEIMLHLAV